MAPPTFPETPTQAPRGPLFAALVGKYGLGPALEILKLLDPNASDLGKGLSGARLAGTAAQGAGTLASNPMLATVGKGLGAAAAGAGLGYGLYDTATNPNLSTKQKVGHSSNLAGETAVATAVPYGVIGVLAKHINGMLEQSKSPQVSGVGKGIGFVARPVEGLLGVLAGDRSPRAAGNIMIAQARDTPILGKAISPILDLFGLGTKPTTGTQFRDQIASLFDRIPALKGTDTSRYNMAGGVDAYNAFSPQVRQQAEALAARLTPLASASKGNPAAYQGQLANILLNRFGKTGIPGVA